MWLGLAVHAGIPAADSPAGRGVSKGPGTDGGPILSRRGDTPSRPQARTAIDTTLPLRSHRPNDGPYSSSTTEVVIRLRQHGR